MNLGNYFFPIYRIKKLPCRKRELRTLNNQVGCRMTISSDPIPKYSISPTAWRVDSTVCFSLELENPQTAPKFGERNSME
jgi:hypothetical protein